ncbi:MAG: tyrosine-type recombinase/integrase [Panacagrimonas sp.]
MSAITLARLARDIDEFLAFKRALGHSYHRSELTLRSFQRFARRHLDSQERLPKRSEVVFDEVLKAWLARGVSRKAVSVGLELGVLRQFCLYRRRRDPRGFVPERDWAPQTESTFQPRILSYDEVRSLLNAAAQHHGRNISAGLLHTLLLILYCTGLHLGEAARLQMADLDRERLVLTIRHSKGKSRLVPFSADLAHDIGRYLVERARIAKGDRAATSGALVLRLNGKPLTVRVMRAAKDREAIVDRRR